MSLFGLPGCLEDFVFFDHPTSNSDNINHRKKNKSKNSFRGKQSFRGKEFFLIEDIKDDMDLPDLESVAASSLDSSASTGGTESTDLSVNSELTFGSNTIQEKYNNAMHEIVAISTQMTSKDVDSLHIIETSSHTEVVALRSKLERIQKADAVAREQLELANKSLQRRLQRALYSNREINDKVKEKMKKELSTRKARSNALSKRLVMEIAARRSTEAELEKMKVKMEAMEREIKRYQGNCE